MGCGGSKASVKVVPLISEEESALKRSHTNKVILNGDSIHKGANLSNGTSHSNGTKPDILHQTVTNENKDFERNMRNEKRKTPEPQETCKHGRDGNESDVLPTVSKGIAFDVAFNENNNIEKLASPKRRPPHKLQKLESAPKLTTEMLAQKIAAAEENRQKVLEKRAKRASKKNKEQQLSKRRKELMEARDFEMQTTMENKLVAYDQNRSKAQAAIVAKQKQREERAQRVRNKAQKIKDGDDAVPVMVDPDETYNAGESEDEQWDDSVHNNSKTQSDASSEEGRPQMNYDSNRSFSPSDNRDVHDFFNS